MLDVTKNYIINIKDEFDKLEIKDNLLLEELIKTFEVSLIELNLDIMEKNVLIEYFGTPKSYILNYIESRDYSIDLIGKQARFSNFKNDWNEMRTRPGREVDNLVINLAFVFYSAFVMVIYFSEIPKMYLPHFSYYTLSENWGIDNSFITIAIVLFFPMFLEIITGVFAIYPISHKYMNYTRNSFRFMYLILGISGLYFRNTPAFILVHLFYEIAFLNREYNLHRTIKDSEIKFYRNYLIISFVIYIIVSSLPFGPSIPN